MAKEIIFGNPKAGDYVAVTAGDKVVMMSEIKRVTPRQIVVGGKNHYWRDTGRRVHESTRGDAARPSNEWEYRAWIDREDGRRKKREREEAAIKAEAGKEENKIVRAIASAAEFERDRVRALPIWRLRMAYWALNHESTVDSDVVEAACGNRPVKLS